MKKLFTLSIAAALFGAAYAQEMKIFSCGLGIPGIDEPQLMAEAISPDGKYICGAIEMGEGFFIANTETGEIKFETPEWIDADGAELRCIDNFGTAIGFCGQEGITYNFGDREVTILEAPDGAKSILGEAITNDGSLMVGSILDGETHAAYSKDGGEWTRLPMPSDEEILLLMPKVTQASAAKRVSADGKVILGYIGSFGVPCLWILNDEGEYVPDLFPTRFLKLNPEDLNDDSKPLTGLSAHFLNMSNNGRYVCSLGLIPKGDEIYYYVPIVYDITTQSLTVYSEDQEIDYIGEGLYPVAIADDGTFIGTVGKPFFKSFGSFIMKAGQKEAELFVDVFPSFYERYENADLSGMNIPTGISADGRYITGYVFFSENYNDVNSLAYYESYLIDRGSDAAVDMLAPVNKTSETIYSVDGRSLRTMTKGLNIVRNSDGSVSKILKK